MVSAADLMKQHRVNNQPDTSAVIINSEKPIMEDPFPPTPSVAASVKANGKVNGKPNGPHNPQPDFSSETAFPSLGAAVAQPKGQWGASKGIVSASASVPASPSAVSTATLARSNANRGSASTWNGSAPVIQRSIQQHSFSLSLSDDTMNRLSSVLYKVQNKHRNVKIEASTTRKTCTTTFVLKASDDASIKNAKKEISVLLAKHVSIQIMIPASLRAFIIGPKGKNLKAITDQTGVRINIPPRETVAVADVADATSGGGVLPPMEIDYDNDEQVAITLEGDEINVKQAQSMIQAIVSERTSQTTQRLAHIDHVFYPFISGVKGANVAKLESEIGQDDIIVRIPPRAAFIQAKENEDETEASEPKKERDLAIIVSGDREKVTKMVAAIESQVDEMKRSFRTLAISIPKRQHRFLVGEAANEILASTSCSVELASIDDPSDSVTIRGPQSQLPLALTAAMEKANAVKVEVVDVVALHRGAASAGTDPLTHAKNVLRWLNLVAKIPRSQGGVQVYYPRPAIVESSATVQIEIVGPDANEVKNVRETIQELVKRVPPSFMLEIDVDPLVHRFIVGKKGQGLKPYESRGVDVLFPSVTAATADGETRSDVLLVLGRASVVDSLPADKKARDAKAKEILHDLKEVILKAQTAAVDIRTETLTVAAKLHRAILGPNGTTLNAVIGEERAVMVKFGLGKSGEKSAATTSKSSSPPVSEDSIVVRGPSSEVERVVKELKRIADEAEQDAIINGHVIEMNVDASHVPHLVGRGGAAVTKLREELGIRIDFGEPSSQVAADEGKRKSSSRKVSTTQVILTGRKENVEEAKKRLLAQAEKLADETTIVVKIPTEMHGSIIGQGGKYVTRLQDTYGVRINFPSAKDGGASTPPATATANGENGASSKGRSEHKSDEVIIKGGKKGVEGAKAELLELLDYEKEHNNVLLLTVSSKSIARIMGKGGATINQIRDETEAQIDIDKEDGGKVVTIKLRGTKNAIAAARDAIQVIAKEVDAEETYQVTIAAEHHGLLIGPQGQNIRDLIIRAGGPEDAKASSQYVQFPRRGDKATDIVIVRGPAEVAQKIRDELTAAAKILADRIVYGVVVAPQAQRMLIGRGGSRQNELQAKYNVRLVFPGWKEYSATGVAINVSELSGGDDSNIVKIVGSMENACAIAKEIQETFASVSKVVHVPRAVHTKLATPPFFRQLRSDFGVSVDTPTLPSSLSSGSLTQPTARIDTESDQNEEENDEFEFRMESLDLESNTTTCIVEWTLTGRDEQAVSKAENKIQSTIQKVGQFSHQAKMIIDSTIVPRIIGRGGSGLMQIQSETGASVEIPRDSGGLCILRGSKNSILQARDRIIRIVTRSS